MHSQQDQWIEINLNAFVLDYDTKESIPFAEAKIKYKNIGTLTESEGKFSLNYFERNVDDNDVFQLTANGYDTISTSLARLYKFLNNTNKFYLNKTKSNNQWFEQDSDNANFIFGKIFVVLASKIRELVAHDFRTHKLLCIDAAELCRAELAIGTAQTFELLSPRVHLSDRAPSRILDVPRSSSARLRLLKSKIIWEGELAPPPALTF